MYIHLHIAPEGRNTWFCKHVHSTTSYIPQNEGEKQVITNNHLVLIDLAPHVFWGNRSVLILSLLLTGCGGFVLDGLGPARGCWGLDAVNLGSLTFTLKLAREGNEVGFFFCIEALLLPFDLSVVSCHRRGLLFTLWLRSTWHRGGLGHILIVWLGGSLIQQKPS